LAALGLGVANDAAAPKPKRSKLAILLSRACGILNSLEIKAARKSCANRNCPRDAGSTFGAFQTERHAETNKTSICETESQYHTPMPAGVVAYLVLKTPTRPNNCK
jgi:hypothetical protein